MHGYVGPSVQNLIPHGSHLLPRGYWVLGNQRSAGSISDLAMGPGHDSRHGTLEVTQAVVLLIPLACSDLTHGT